MPNPFGLISEESFNSKMTDISNGLIAINDTLKKAFIPSSWEVLQQKVRSNDMEDINLGDEILSSYNGAAFTWTIVGKNVDTSLGGNSLTLLSKNLLSMAIKYNDEWCIYECENALSAGKYRIDLYINGSSSYTTFYFKTTKQIPAGGVIIASGYGFQSGFSPFYAYLTLKTKSSRRYKSTTIETGISATSTTVSGSTNLSALTDVYVYGSPSVQNYKYLQIRKWLNSDKSNYEWWEQIYNGDVEPSYGSSMNGFMKGIDPQLVSVLGKKKFDDYISDYFYIADYTNYSYLDTDAKRNKGYIYFTRSKIYNSSGAEVSVASYSDPRWETACRFAIMCNVM